MRRARQKLEAAEVLLRQEHPAPASELLGILLCASALRSGAKVPPESYTAGVWLYANALPSGKLQSDDAALIMRAVALAQAEE